MSALLLCVLTALPEVSVVVSRRIELSATAAAPIVATFRATATRQGLSTVRQDDLTDCDGAMGCVTAAARRNGWAFVIHLDLASVGSRLLFRAELIRAADGTRLASEVAAVSGAEALTEPLNRFIQATVSALTPVPSAVVETPPPALDVVKVAPAAPGEPAAKSRVPAWLSFGGAGLAIASAITFALVRVDVGTRLEGVYRIEGDARRSSVLFGTAAQLASDGNAALLGSVVSFVAALGLSVFGFVLLSP
jgi:hypothetical protein